MTRPRRYGWYRVTHFVVGKIMNVLLKLEVSGIERLPPTGPLVLISNHTNFIDPVLIFTIHNRYVKALTAAKNARRPGYNYFIWAVDAIPIKRGTPDREAIRAAIKALEVGWPLYVAPEGTRNHHGRMQEAKAGVTLILLRAGTHIPIYPVAFVGLEHFGENIKRLRRTPAKAIMGDPFYLAPPQGRIRREHREQMTAEMMGQIAALLPPENRGVYADQIDKPPQYLRFEPPPSEP